MRGTTHIIIGICATGLMLETADPLCLFAGGVAALLPDIDKSDSTLGQVLFPISHWFERRFPHRSCTHSIVASGILALIIYPFAAVGYVYWNVAHSVNIGFFVGYIADAFTKAGIELFWPCRVRFVCPGNRKFRLQTGSLVENVVVFILTAVTVFVININIHGGIKTQFNRVTAIPDGVAEVYKQKGAKHLIVAHIKGVRSSDAEPVEGDFWVIEPHGKDFIVQSKTGEIYKAGNEADSQLQTDSIIADADSPASIKIKSISLDNDEISEKLDRFDRLNTMVYVSGELKIDNPIDLHIGRDSRQFTTIRESGDSITLDDAPLATVNRKLGDQLATGDLSVRSIFLVDQ